MAGAQAGPAMARTTIFLLSGLGGPCVALGPLRVGEWMRERVLGFSAVWPSDARACPWLCASVSVFHASVSSHVPLGALGVAVIWSGYLAAVP